MSKLSGSTRQYERHSSTKDNSATSWSSTDVEAPDTFVKTSFTEEEESYLQTFIPAWQAKFYGGGKDCGKKGKKKRWVIQKLYTGFITKFFGNATLRPQDDILQHRMYRWFLNRPGEGTTRASQLSPRSRSSSVHVLKKPRSTNGLEVFSEEKREEITQLSRKKSSSSLSPSTLASYKQSRKELWDTLTDDVRDTYHQKALDRNEAIRLGPTDDDIEKNQVHIVQHTLDALSNLTGHHWNGHGDVVYFVMGAHRKKSGQLFTFQGSVLEDEKFANKGFHRMYPQFTQEMKQRFQSWAENVVPGETTTAAPVEKTGNPAPHHLSSEDELPAFPGSSPEETSPNDARAFLYRYIVAAWNHDVGDLQPDVPVPWKALRALDENRILRNTHLFEGFTSLDPYSISTEDVYSILKIIVNGQKNGGKPLQFVVDHEPSPRALSSSPRGHDSSSDSDNTVEQSSEEIMQQSQADFSPPRPKGSLNQSSAVLLDIDPTVTGTLGRLPLRNAPKKRIKQAGGGSEQTDLFVRNVSRKRKTQDEMDEERPVSQPARQKRKTQRETGSRKIHCVKAGNMPKSKAADSPKNRAAIPMRPQSARIRSANYRNANVTVRPRHP